MHLITEMMLQTCRYGNETHKKLIKHAYVLYLFVLILFLLLHATIDDDNNDDDDIISDHDDDNTI